MGSIGSVIFFWLRRRRRQHEQLAITNNQAKIKIGTGAVDPFLSPNTYNNDSTRPRPKIMLHSKAPAVIITRQRNMTSESDNSASFGPGTYSQSLYDSESQENGHMPATMQRDGNPTSSMLPSSITSEQLRNEVESLRRDLERMRWQGLLGGASEAPPSYGHDEGSNSFGER